MTASAAGNSVRRRARFELTERPRPRSCRTPSRTRQGGPSAAVAGVEACVADAVDCSAADALLQRQSARSITPAPHAGVFLDEFLLAQHRDIVSIDIKVSYA
jgi:hypothetical protein